MGKIAYSSTVSNIRGKVGTNVYSKGRSGPTLRIKAPVKNPKTSAQTGVRGNLRKASKLYEGMTSSQAKAWTEYGDQQSRSNPVTGDQYTLSGINAFTELATKFLQVNPAGTVPMDPPSAEFPGDTVTLTASISSGTITFTASGANAAGVTTEILLEPLPSRNRQPSVKALRHQVFKAFASGSLTQAVSVPPGFYAAGYRFVKTATGQMTPIVMMGVQQVLTLEAGGDQGEGEAEAAAA
ncbi:MAG TPA: hypothetical protein VEX38_04290 [Fimbriimonadaceae bacterium]|nr:hypothetical protein [Fimbriimonadaceae bacterium]